MRQVLTSPENHTFLPQDILTKSKKWPELSTKGFPFSKPFISDAPWPTDAKASPSKRQGKDVPFGLHFAQSPGFDSSTTITIPEGACYDPTMQVYILAGSTGSFRWVNTKVFSSWGSTWKYTYLGGVGGYELVADAVYEDQADKVSDRD